MNFLISVALWDAHTSDDSITRREMNANMIISEILESYQTNSDSRAQYTGFKINLSIVHRKLSMDRNKI